MANDDQTPVVPPVLTVVPPVSQAVPAAVPVTSQPVPAVEAVVAPVTAAVEQVVAAPVQAEVAQVAASVTQATAPVLSFSEKLEAGVGYLWKNDKVFLLVFGILIVIGYVSGTLMDLITNKSRSDVESAKTQDAALAAKENDAKAQAASYQQAAAEAAKDEPTVDEDWNVKK